MSIAEHSSKRNNNNKNRHENPNAANTSAATLAQLLARQQRACLETPSPSLAARLKAIKAIRPALVEHADEFAAAINADFGCRSPHETKVLEIIPNIHAINHLCENLGDWMQPRKRNVHPTYQPGYAKVIYQPLGVVGIIVPWNFPLVLSIGPLICALGAGNRVMLKMSEYTPHTAALLKKILGAIFTEDQVAVVTGDAETGAAFAALPFDHLLFTGATNIGRKVMRAAAENLTPVTLELGGKSPAIIHESFPLDAAVERICFGKLLNAGQICVAPDYLLLPEKNVTAFIQAITTVVKTWYPTLRDNPDYTAIINQQHRDRLQQLLNDAAEKGAKIVTLNPANESFNDSLKMPISLVLDTNDSMRIEHEEIFGPILLIKTYSSLVDAIQYINARPRPLALYYFDLEESRQDYVINNTRAGGGCINDALIHVGAPDVPFGGIGDSGMGHYHGWEGFLTFSKARGIVYKGAVSSSKLIFPPWGRSLHKVFYKMFLR